MHTTKRLTIGSIVTGCLTTNWNVGWEEVQKHVLKDFPNSQFKATHMPIYRRYVFEGRLAFDDNKIPDEVWQKHAAAMLVARRHRNSGAKDAVLTNRKGGWPKTSAQKPTSKKTAKKSEKSEKSTPKPATIEK